MWSLEKRVETTPQIYFWKPVQRYSSWYRHNSVYSTPLSNIRLGNEGLEIWLREDVLHFKPRLSPSLLVYWADSKGRPEQGPLSRSSHELAAAYVAFENGAIAAFSLTRSQLPMWMAEDHSDSLESAFDNPFLYPPHALWPARKKIICLWALSKANTLPKTWESNS